MSLQELSALKQSLNRSHLPILALDIGRKRIGVAISDISGRFAAPIKAITTDSFADGIEMVLETVTENAAKGLLIGVPQKFTDGHQSSIDMVQEFHELLVSKSEIPIYFTDESYSTHEASDLINWRSRRKNSGQLDSAAAAIFLQNFLDSSKNETDKDTNNSAEKNKPEIRLR